MLMLAKSGKSDTEITDVVLLIVTRDEKIINVKDEKIIYGVIKYGIISD